MNIQNNKPYFKNRFNWVYIKALDLGAGIGKNILLLLPNSFKVTSVDSSEEGLKILKDNTWKE